jgi:hypothetical protein
VRTTWTAFAWAVAVLAASACSPGSTGASPESAAAENGGRQFADSATSAEIHAALLDPGSDALYTAESEPPATDEGWAAVERAAAKMIQGAALMQTGSRPAGRAEWIRISKLTEDASRKSAAAVRERDVEKLAEADGEFTAQCEDCHNAFRDKAGGGMASEPGH